MTLDQLVTAIRSAHDSHAPLRIRGAGSKDFYGGMLAGEVLDVSGHRGIVAYEPTELYITAKCGTPLAEVEQTMLFDLESDYGQVNNLAGKDDHAEQRMIDLLLRGLEEHESPAEQKERLGLA